MGVPQLRDLFTHLSPSVDRGVDLTRKGAWAELNGPISADSVEDRAAPGDRSRSGLLRGYSGFSGDSNGGGAQTLRACRAGRSNIPILSSKTHHLDKRRRRCYWTPFQTGWRFSHGSTSRSGARGAPRQAKCAPVAVPHMAVLFQLEMAAKIGYSKECLQQL